MQGKVGVVRSFVRGTGKRQEPNLARKYSKPAPRVSVPQNRIVRNPRGR